MKYINMIIIILILILILVLLYVKFTQKKEHFEINSKIPKVIYLSYKTKNIPDYVIPNWKKIYPDYEVKLYDNNDCIKFLLDEYGQEYVDIFNFIKDGPIKADFWRVCILYKYGGIYSDIDIEPLVNIETILEKDVTFLTCISDTITASYNPHFIVTVPNHKILKYSIDIYLDYYRNKKPYAYWSWSIVFIFENALLKIFKKNITKDETVVDNENNKYQFMKEIIPSPNTFFDFKTLYNRLFDNPFDVYCKYKNIRILNNRYKQYINHKF